MTDVIELERGLIEIGKQHPDLEIDMKTGNTEFFKSVETKIEDKIKQILNTPIRGSNASGTMYLKVEELGRWFKAIRHEQFKKRVWERLQVNDPVYENFIDFLGIDIDLIGDDRDLSPMEIKKYIETRFPPGIQDKIKIPYQIDLSTHGYGKGFLAYYAWQYVINDSIKFGMPGFHYKKLQELGIDVSKPKADSMTMEELKEYGKRTE